MAIRQRGTRWQVDVKVPKNLREAQGASRVRETCDTYEQAQVLENDIRGTFLKRQVWKRTKSRQGSNKVTVDDVARIAWSKFWRDQKSWKTHNHNMTTVLRHLGEDTPIRDIDTVRVDEFVDEMRENGLSNGTINRKLTALSVMLKIAEDRGYISKRPKIDRPREGKGRILTIDDTEMGEDGLLSFFAQTEPEMRDICIVLIDTGMRTGECLWLRRENLDNGHVTLFETKNDEARTIPLTTRAKRVLWEYAEGKGRREYLFSYNQDRLRRAWDRMRAAFGEEDNRQLVPHTLRHSFCSRLVRKGVQFGKVQKLAGHKAIATTLRYSHLAPSNLDDAITVLEEEG